MKRSVVPVLFITGSLGTGKSAVAQEISNLLADRGVVHAFVDLDALTDLYPRPIDDRFNTRIMLQNLKAVWTNYSSAGAKVLVLARVVEHMDELNDYAAVIPGADIKVIRLTASPRTMLQRLKGREAGSALERHLERAVSLAEQLEGDGIGHLVVENENKSLRTVAEEVLTQSDWISTERAPGRPTDGPELGSPGRAPKAGRTANAGEFLQQLVTVKVDRPLGSEHPDFPGSRYPLNYGEIPDTIAPDGDLLDAYVIGVTEEVSEYEGLVVAVVHRRDDVENKLVVAPVGMNFSREEIWEAIRFQEQHFDSELITQPPSLITEGLQLMPLDDGLSDQMETWWEDAQTKRWMGGYRPQQALYLARHPPREFRGRTIVRRVALAALEIGQPVALVDFESYVDGTAGVGIVVAPSARNSGVGRTVLKLLIESEHLKDVREVFGGLEPENAASVRCFEAAGFVADSTEPDEEGIVYYRRLLSRP